MQNQWIKRKPSFPESRLGALLRARPWPSPVHPFWSDGGIHRHQLTVNILRLRPLNSNIETRFNEMPQSWTKEKVTPLGSRRSSRMLHDSLPTSWVEGHATTGLPQQNHRMTANAGKKLNMQQPYISDSLEKHDSLQLRSRQPTLKSTVLSVKIRDMRLNALQVKHTSTTVCKWTWHHSWETSLKQNSTAYSAKHLEHLYGRKFPANWTSS